MLPLRPGPIFLAPQPIRGGVDEVEMREGVPQMIVATTISPTSKGRVERSAESAFPGLDGSCLVWGPMHANQHSQRARVGHDRANDSETPGLPT